MTTERGSTTRILMVEPVCRGFEHVRVNASVLATLLLAHPEADVLFLGEEEHRSGIRALLEERFPDNAPRVRWDDARVPPRHAGTAAKLPIEVALLLSAFDRARRENVDLVFFSSASETFFFLLKLFLLPFRKRTPVLAAAHGVLATLVTHAGGRFLASLRGMRLVFRLPHPRQFAYVLFGETIRASLRPFSATASDRSVVIDLPYLWDEPAIPATTPDPAPTFSFFGASGGRGKRFDRFAAAADIARTRYPALAFSVVGHLSTVQDRERYADAFPDAALSSLTPAQYAAAARQATYALSVGDPDVYRFGASSSFLDALSFLKPGIYLENPYLAECFRTMGDIGYLCSSPDEVTATVLALAGGIPHARYRSQQESIMTGRRKFDPATIAPQLRSALDDLRLRIR
jgi:hypothetical protein